jgi:hypothetical protein
MRNRCLVKRRLGRAIRPEVRAGGGHQEGGAVHRDGGVQFDNVAMCPRRVDPAWVQVRDGHSPPFQVVQAPGAVAALWADDISAQLPGAKSGCAGYKVAALEAS